MSFGHVKKTAEQVSNVISAQAGIEKSQGIEHRLLPEGDRAKGSNTPGVRSYDDLFSVSLKHFQSRYAQSFLKRRRTAFEQLDHCVQDAIDRRGYTQCLALAQDMAVDMFDLAAFAARQILGGR